MLRTSESLILKLLKRLLPKGIRILLRRIHQYFIWRSAIRRFKLDYHRIENIPELVDDLVYGWGNMGWSAFHDYTIGIVRAARENSGNVLECGSGLSTVLLGIIAQDRGFMVYSLEHEEKWRVRIQRVLDDLQLTNVRLLLTPIVRYDSFDWYSLSDTYLPDSFTLVVCDGPPHYTRGGRYGLLPVMYQKLYSDSIVLLDDVSREHEREVVARWEGEFGIRFKIMGQSDLYAEISRIGSMKPKPGH